METKQTTNKVVNQEISGHRMSDKHKSPPLKNQSVDGQKVKNNKANEKPHLSLTAGRTPVPQALGSPLQRCVLSAETATNAMEPQ